MTADKPGEIILAVNDIDSANNRNAFKVTISITRKFSPCNDNEVIVEYDRKSSSYHHYGPVITQICLTSNPQCSIKSVFSAMTSQVRFITPTENPSEVKNCMETDVNIPGLFGVDDVRVLVNPGDYNVTNYTRKNHALYPGMR